MLIDQTINDRATLLLQKMNDENIRAALDEIGTRDRTLKRAGESVLGIALGALCIVLLFVALIFSDINKSKRYKQALEEARRKAEDLMENRQRLLLSISHDIRSPLNSIMGYVELLSSNPSPDKVARYTASMRYSSAHLMELLTNLLEYSRIETGKMTLDAAPFEVFPLFDQTLGMFVPSAERKGVSLVSDNRAEKGMYVKADAARIRQVLINLLSNAVKFTDRGSVTLSAVVRSGDGNGAPLRLEFAVSDTGCGIAPEERRGYSTSFRGPIRPARRAADSGWPSCRVRSSCWEERWSSTVGSARGAFSGSRYPCCPSPFPKFRSLSRPRLPLGSLLVRYSLSRTIPRNEPCWAKY